MEQPLGTYYATVLPAELLLDVCFSDRLKAHKVDGGTYVLEGTQRLLDEKRLKAIGGFISRIDSAFPNTIILAANSRLLDGLIEESQDTRWTVEANSDCGDFTITIPTKEKLSAIIDGQHRLFSFAYAPERLNMSLVCSVFFDLPKPFQAQLFATINSTQKPVNKSQTYELFGYNISEESESYWSPDKLAVFFTRRLNTMDDSPLKGKIAIAPEADAPLQLLAAGDDWQVSMATVVEGILRLISTNPKQDSNELLGQAGTGGDVGGWFANLRADLLDAVLWLLQHQQSMKALRLLHRVNIRPNQVLDQSGFHCFGIGEVDELSVSSTLSKRNPYWPSLVHLCSLSFSSPMI